MTTSKHYVLYLAGATPYARVDMYVGSGWYIAMYFCSHHVILAYWVLHAYFDDVVYNPRNFGYDHR